MPYASQADLVARYGAAEVQQLSDIEQAGTIDAARVALALQDASDEIDGYISGRYTLPLTTVPRILTLHCCTVARLRLAELSSVGGPTTDMSDAYKATLAWLREVGDGRFSLGLDATNTPATSAGGAVTFHPGRRQFDERSLRDYTDPPVEGVGFGSLGRPGEVW